MATVTYAPPKEEDTKNYEFRKPVIFSRDQQGHLQAELQTPLHKTAETKEVTSQPPVQEEPSLTNKAVVRKEETDKKTRVTFRR